MIIDIDICSEAVIELALNGLEKATLGLSLLLRLVLVSMWCGACWNSSKLEIEHRASVGTRPV
jgi:hypothetical protein